MVFKNEQIPYCIVSCIIPQNDIIRVTLCKQIKRKKISAFILMNKNKHKHSLFFGTLPLTCDSGVTVHHKNNYKNLLKRA